MLDVQQFINSADTYEIDALSGFASAHPDLVRWNESPSFVVRRQQAENKVAIVSGGGSGHEPLHTGFVGAGMLDAAVPGHVFTSPTPGQIVAATSAVAGDAGVLLLVKNYTGDVINFRLAAEILGAGGTRIRSVIVDDDLATETDDAGQPGRRGTAATLVVEKVCGAAAEAGATLDEVAAHAVRVASRSRSLAVSYSGSQLPGSGTRSFEVPAEEIEFGVGIHGERGIARQPLQPVSDLVADMVDAIATSLTVRQGSDVIAVVNGLGATPAAELYVAFGELERCLKERGVTIARNLVGSYVTALDMRGFSVTLTVADKKTLELWDAPVRTTALSW